jgi:DNA mismatch endonuclease, patch repair protein
MPTCPDVALMFGFYLLLAGYGEVIQVRCLVCSADWDGRVIGVVVSADRLRSQTGASPYPEPLNEARSRSMRGNRRTDTKPEIALRGELHRLGYRYRKDHRLDLPGGVRVRPDIVFTRRRIAVFVDGCFWHVCPDHGTKPARNEWYWTPKLRRNVERDHLVNKALTEAGWRVVRIWEHEDLRSAASQVRTVIEREADAD